MKLLEIQSSARQQGSISRLLSQEFVELQKQYHPSIEHKQRDVANKIILPLILPNFGQRLTTFHQNNAPQK